MSQRDKSDSSFVLLRTSLYGVPGACSCHLWEQLTLFSVHGVVILRRKWVVPETYVGRLKGNSLRYWCPLNALNSIHVSRNPLRNWTRSFVDGQTALSEFLSVPYTHTNTNRKVRINLFHFSMEQVSFLRIIYVVYILFISDTIWNDNMYIARKAKNLYSLNWGA